MVTSSVIPKLACSAGRRDEKPNIELAVELSLSGDMAAVKELVEHLRDKNKHIRADCIKVLYELGERNPDMVAPYADQFIALLHSKNNRLVWGAMAALNTIAALKPEELFTALPMLIAFADKGTVITRDKTMGIMFQLCAFDKYRNSVFPLLNEQILRCPLNQLAMYAERTLPVIRDENRQIFVQTLLLRLRESMKDSQRKRVEKVLRKAEKKK